MHPPISSSRRAILSILLAAAITGCVAPPGPRGAADGVLAAVGTPLARSELVFGRGRPGGGLVTEAEWGAFVDEHVTPRFPDGLTVFDATGQYRTRAGELVREPSKVILILHAPDAGHRAALEEIRAIYKRLFGQESVLLVTSEARVAF